MHSHRISAPSQVCIPNNVSLQCCSHKKGIQGKASGLSEAGWDFRTAIDKTMPVKESFVCTKHSVGHSTHVTAAKVQNKRCKCNNNINNNNNEAANQRA